MVESKVLVRDCQFGASCTLREHGWHGLRIAFFAIFPFMVRLRSVILPCMLSMLLMGCNHRAADNVVSSSGHAVKGGVLQNSPVLHVLGTLQDGGAPHMGCDRPCCRNLFLRPVTDRKVVSLGISDETEAGGELAMFEATPDVASQLHALQSAAGLTDVLPSIFLTHAHIGHYAGLMNLGREVLGAVGVQVYAMPRFRAFLESNGPWDQLVSLGNVELNSLKADSLVQVTKRVQARPILVPHRDEYSETVGYRILGPNRSVLFIPDINKWGLWDRDLAKELALVDRAYLDATFFDASEVGNRDMSEIPHPFMVETMALLSELNASERAKIQFIHLNHTNPCLSDTSVAYRQVLEAGFQVARMHDEYPL